VPAASEAGFVSDFSVARVARTTIADIFWMTLLAITSKTGVAQRRRPNKSVRARALTSRITFPSYSRCVQRSIPTSKHQPVEANPALLLCPLVEFRSRRQEKISIGQQKNEEYLNECGCTTAPGEAGCTACVFPKQ